MIFESANRVANTQELWTHLDEAKGSNALEQSLVHPSLQWAAISHFINVTAH